MVLSVLMEYTVTASVVVPTVFSMSCVCRDQFTVNIIIIQRTMQNYLFNCQVPISTDI